MNILKTLARSLTILGPICIAIGFISIFFLQIHLGEITLPGSFRSETFYMEKGKSYSIKASGTNYPFGSSGGEVTFFLTGGMPVLSFNIYFSFDGDSTSQEVIIGDFTAPVSGDYYFQYAEEYSSIHRPVKLIVQESLIEHYIGFNSLEIMIFGVILLIAGYILPKGSDWINRRIEARSTEERHESIEIDESFDIITEVGETSCPNCGFIDEGIYCSNCGSRLRNDG
ncbi:MAG: zinc ribbon domain-containing protein [Candidatus Heimdallarchaeota archaeon]|nr:MAG: zinc ribbon domain-containing protein [Candidatus Heimdallarchaeota archaeon]